MKIFILLAMMIYSSIAFGADNVGKFDTMTTNNPNRVKIDINKPVQVNGGVAIGGTLNTSSVLDIQSTTKGVLPPRMTTLQMNSISSPPNGLTVFNTDFNSLASYNSTISKWVYGFGNISIDTSYDLYTSTLTGFGATTTADLYMKRVGDRLLVRGYLFMGAAGGGGYGSFTLPSGVVPKASKYPAVSISSSCPKVGNLIEETNYVVPLVYCSLTGPAVIYTGARITGVSQSTSPLIPETTGNWATSSAFIVIDMDFEVEGWTGNTNAWIQANSNPILSTTEFSANINTSGVTSKENVDWIDTSGVVAATFTFDFKPGLFTVAPNCVYAHSKITNNVVFLTNSITSSQLVVTVHDSTSGGDQAVEFSVVCQKQGVDYTNAHSPFIIGTFAGVARTIDNLKIDEYNIQWGGTTLEDVCASGSCFIESDATGVTVAVTSSVYTIVLPKTYPKIICGLDYATDGGGTAAKAEPYLVGTGVKSGVWKNTNTIHFRGINLTSTLVLDVLAGIHCKGYN